MTATGWPAASSRARLMAARLNGAPDEASRTPAGASSSRSPPEVEMGQIWEMGRCLEEGQVAVDLPVADHRVPGVEFLALDLGVIVDVVPVRRLAQRVAEHVVGDELVRGV
jgi:hypothetical protein